MTHGKEKRSRLGLMTAALHIYLSVVRRTAIGQTSLPYQQRVRSRRARRASGEGDSDVPKGKIIAE